MTQQEVSNLSDIELALEMAKIAGIPKPFIRLDESAIGQKHYSRNFPDYLNSYDAFDDLCKKLGVRVDRTHIVEQGRNVIQWRIDTSPPVYGFQNEDAPKCIGGCRAILLLAKQERK